MAPKETKTAAELAHIIMGEIRSQPDLGYIRGVVIIARKGESPNWQGTFQIGGVDDYGKPVPSAMPSNWAFKVIENAQSHFDLA